MYAHMWWEFVTNGWSVFDFIVVLVSARRPSRVRIVDAEAAARERVEDRRIRVARERAVRADGGCQAASCCARDVG